jgi:glycosyltransferase involved in cell wall biosynthesis
VSQIAQLSVIVCTKDRAGQLIGTVQSILRNPGDDWELIVVDQSRTEATREALDGEGLLKDSRLRYEPVSSTGVCRARNHGLAIVRGELIAFTDDDCIVPGDWLERITGWFTAVPDLAVFYGRVEAPPIDEGWIQEFHPLVEGSVERNAGDVIRRLGLACNMAITRRALSAIGPFDELLGAGAIFAPADDTDYGYRALALGLKVHVASEPSVTHLGIQRSGAASARNLRGMPAMCAKHVRCGDVGMLAPPLRLMAELLARGTLALVRGRRPSGYRSAVNVVYGLVVPLKYAVDTRGRLYRPASTSR